MNARGVQHEDSIPIPTDSNCSIGFSTTVTLAVAFEKCCQFGLEFIFLVPVVIETMIGDSLRQSRFCATRR